MKDKVVLVTGGSSGIGKATAEKFVKAGAQVIIAARNRQNGEMVAQKLGATFIPQLAVDSGVRAVNFLAFNPFEDQQIAGKRDETNVPLYSEVSPHLNTITDVDSN